jgi:hypothetical protein
MNTSHALSTSLIGLALVLGSPAAAFDFRVPWIETEASFEITETLTFDFHDDNVNRDPLDDDYYDLRNRLNLRLAIDAFTLSARIDTLTFFDTPEIPDNKPLYLGRYAPEKIWGRYTHNLVQVDLGDFYAVFGRAMVLRVQKTDELSEDTSLLGAKVRLKLSPVELTLLGGFSNPTNFDAIEEKTLLEPYDLISGLRVSYRPTSQFHLGAHGVLVMADPFDVNPTVSSDSGKLAQNLLPEHTGIAGFFAECPDLWDAGDVYAEFNWMQRSFRDPERPAEKQGWALYAGGHAYLGNWTLTAELKAYDGYELFTWTDSGATNDYRSMRIDYIRPPTLEPSDIEVKNNHDVTGARLAVDWRPNDAQTLLSASYAGFVAREYAPSGSEAQVWIYNLNLAVEQDFLRTGRAKITVGLREEVPEYENGEHRNLVYLSALLKMPLSTRHSLELIGKHWFLHKHRNLPAVDSDTLIGDLSLAYNWSPWGSIGLILGWDTDTSLSGSRELDTFYTPQGPGGLPHRQLFLAGSLLLNLFDVVTLKVLGGQLHGGLLCANGACRFQPPFAGVRFEAVFRM